MTPAAAVQVNVMVVFYSRYGATEKLALAGGLGAIQARGNLRLRRLADLADPKQIAGDAEWSTNLQRMSREYIAPRPIDLAWADVVMLAAPSPCEEMQAYLSAVIGQGNGHKFAAVITPWKAMCEAAAMLGFQVASAPPEATDPGLTAFGKSVCEKALTGKT